MIFPFEPSFLIFVFLLKGISSYEIKLSKGKSIHILSLSTIIHHFQHTQVYDIETIHHDRSDMI